MKKIMYLLVFLTVMIMTACGMEKAEAALSHCTKFSSDSNNVMNKLENTDKMEIEVSNENTFGIIGWKADVQNILSTLENIIYTKNYSEKANGGIKYNIKITNENNCIWSAKFEYNQNKDSYIIVDSDEGILSYNIDCEDAEQLYNHISSRLIN